MREEGRQQQQKGGLKEKVSEGTGKEKTDGGVCQEGEQKEERRARETEED